MNISQLPKHYRTKLLNSSFCIRKKPVSTPILKNLLKAHTAKTVEFIYHCSLTPEEINNYWGRKLRKDEHIELLEQLIPNTFTSFAKYSGLFEFCLYTDIWITQDNTITYYQQKLLKNSCCSFDYYATPRRVFKFIAQNLTLGLMYLFGTNEDNLTLVIPMDLMFALHKSERSMAGFHDYCKVLANLYGICDNKIVINKWNSDHPDNSVSFKTGNSIIDECGMFSQFFYTLDGCVYNSSILNESAFDAILNFRDEYQPYLPSPQEFTQWLNYVDDINENLAEFQTIREHFRKFSARPQAAEQDAVLLLEDLRLGLGHPVSLLEKYGTQIGFAELNEKQTNTIISAIMELNNQAKLWCNYGNSPESLSMPDNFGIEPQSSPKVIPLTKNSPKVDRNAPCPCGSGVKYKKCCGKN